MLSRYFRLIAVMAGALAAVAPLPSAAQDVNNPRCPFWFTNYDNTVQAFGMNSRQRNQSAPGPVMDAARLLRMNNCLSFSDALAAMDTIGPGAGAAALTSSGAAIAPIYLHVGIVTSSDDDARARAFFEAQGLRARSVGAPGLGRRVYVGPFANAGALEGGRALALQAGFAYPYPARF